MKISVKLNYYIQKMNSHKPRFIHEKKNNLSSNFLSDAFAKEKSDSIFVHAGLSKIKLIEGVDNPYEYLLYELKKNYSIIFVPGFTPSFRVCGIFHKKYSKPEYGMWSKLFFKDAKNRTSDAIHSILYIGDYDFSSCDHQNSFGENSCFYKLIEDNVLVADIGTDNFVCTFIHVVENLNRVPYIDSSKVFGVEYFSDTEFSNITQVNYSSVMKYAWNRNKIVRELEKRKILRNYSKNNFKLYFFRAREVFDFLNERLKKDIWYLVK